MAPDYHNFTISNIAPPGGDATIQAHIACIHWFCDRLEVAAGDVLTFDFIGMSQQEFEALGQAAPIFNTIGQDWLGFKHVLTLVSTAALLTANNTNNVIAKMTECLGDDERKNTLFQPLYRTLARPVASTYWDDLKNFAAHILHHVIYMESKIMLALQLADACEAFIRDVDPLPDNLYRLDTGQITLDEARAHNTRGMAAKDLLQTAYNKFWEQRNPPPRTGSWNLEDFHRISPGLQIAPALTIREIRRHQAAGTLHNWSVQIQPITFQRWAEVSDTIKLLDSSFMQLRSYKADPQMELIKRAAAIKSSVQTMMVEIADLDDSEPPDVITLEIISKDIQETYQSLVNLENQGLAWDQDTFGASRTQFKEWRHKVALLLEQGHILKKKKAKEEEGLSQQFSVAAKEAPWTKISKDTWKAWLA